MNNHKTRRPWRGLTFAAATGVAMAAGMLFAPVAAHADTQPSHFTWKATSANISGDLTLINNGATNNQPGALLYVTPNYAPGAICGCVSDNAPIAVYYNSSAGKWGIFNEDATAMPVGAAFNVFVEPAATTDAFQVTATSSNISGDTVSINSTATNGLPNANLQATQVWNGAFNDHATAVWYNGSDWGVFNEGGAAMASGSKYNVLVGSQGGGKAAFLKAGLANTGGNSTHFSSSTTNGDSNTFMLDTPNWDPNGSCGCVYDTSQTGVWYFESFQKVAVFNESNANMQQKVDFDVLYWNS